MVLQGSSRIQAVKGHASAEVQDEAVILHHSEGVYYGLNATGAIVWGALTVPRTVVELVGILRERFDVTEEEATRDVEGLVEELLARGLAELC